jgi:hypothetical protein
MCFFLEAIFRGLDNQLGTGNLKFRYENYRLISC